MGLGLSPDARRVILHIGTEKTGTSSIQAFLAQNWEALAANGILYPLTPIPKLHNTQSHMKLAAFARDEHREDDIRARLRIPCLAAFRETVERDLVAECADSDASVILLSSEHLSLRLYRPDELLRLKRLLGPIGPVTVVIYLRRQEDLLLSRYATGVRLGTTVPFGIPARRALQQKYDYYEVCSRWARIFGAENLKIGLFEPSRLKKADDLLVDFMSLCDISLNMEGMVAPLRQNESLDWRVLEFLRRLNAFLPNLDPVTLRRDPRHGSLLGLMARMPGRTRATLPPAMRQRFNEAFAESNARVAREFLGRADGVLFADDGPRDAAVYNDDMTIEAAFNIFAALWAESQRPTAGAAVFEQLVWPAPGQPGIVRSMQPRVPAKASPPGPPPEPLNGVAKPGKLGSVQPRVPPTASPPGPPAKPLNGADKPGPKPHAAPGAAPPGPSGQGDHLSGQGQ